MALILVIDDDGFYLDVLRNLLTDEGHEVMLAQGGIEGLALYQDRRRGRQPDLVITDMRMPGIDGSDVIRELRKIDSHVRIIAVSGATTFYDVDFLRLARDVGANSILRKLDPMERIIVEVNLLLRSAA
jgi:two-component system, cell cycle sensor histidine kinase and response regulator CckA